MEKVFLSVVAENKCGDLKGNEGGFQSSGYIFAAPERKHDPGAKARTYLLRSNGNNDSRFPPIRLRSGRMTERKARA